MPKRVALAAVLVFLLTPAALNAVTIFVTYEGSVTAVSAGGDGSLSEHFQVGDPISGSFRYETDATDAAEGDPNFGAYRADDVVVEVGSYSTFIGSAELDIFDDWGDPDSDIFLLDFGPTGPPIDGTFLEAWQFAVRDSTGSVFDDDSPPTSLSLGDFDSSSIAFGFVGDGSGIVNGNISTLILTVPEPTAGIFLLAGLLAVAVVGRKQTSLDQLRR